MSDQLNNFQKDAYTAAWYSTSQAKRANVYKHVYEHEKKGINYEGDDYGRSTTPKNIYDEIVSPGVPLSAEGRRNAFNFCNGSCSMLMTNSFTVNAVSTGQPLNSYYYSNYNGSCANTFMTSAFLNFINNPPTALYENYYSCSQDSSTAFFNAFGIAVANASGYGPIAIIIFVNLLILMQFCTGYHIPKSHSSYDRDDAIKALALGLLNVRDGTAPSYNINDKGFSTASRESVMKLLVKELEAQSSIDFFNQDKHAHVFRLKGRNAHSTAASSTKNGIQQHSAQDEIPRAHVLDVVVENPMNAEAGGIAMQDLLPKVNVEILNSGTVITTGPETISSISMSETVADLVGKKATQIVAALLKELEKASKLDFWVISTRTSILQKLDARWLSLSSRRILIEASSVQTGEAKALLDEDDDEDEHANVEEEKKFLIALHSLLRLHISVHCGCSLFDVDDHFSRNKGYVIKGKIVITLESISKASSIL